MIIFILVPHSCRPTLVLFVSHDECAASSPAFIPNFFFGLIKPPESSCSIFRRCRSKAPGEGPSTPSEDRLAERHSSRYVFRIFQSTGQGHTKTPTAIISWPVRLKRRLRLAPQSKGTFQTFLARPDWSEADMKSLHMQPIPACLDGEMKTGRLWLNVYGGECANVYIGKLAVWLLPHWQLPVPLWDGLAP